MSGGLFLGLELSTSQLRALVVDESLIVIAELAVDFDLDLPEFSTDGGLISNPPNTSPAEMWIVALDFLVDRLSRTLDISRIRAIGGSAQHALVWCRPTIFPQLSARQTLHAQIPPSPHFFAQPYVYTPYDASSFSNTLALQTLLGGPSLMASRVGTSAMTNPTMYAGQIFRQRVLATHQSSDTWARTGRILAASSFLASLLLGRYVGMGVAEASVSGMYNPTTSSWDETVLETIAGGNISEARKIKTWLGAVDDSPRGRIGHISRYWVDRYHFEPSTIITPFTTDYMASYLSLAPSSSDCALVFDASNSDVLLSPSPGPAPLSLRRTIVSHPLQNSFINLWITPCASASRTRALVQYAKTWPAFSRLIEVVPPGGSIGLDNKLFSFWAVPSSSTPSTTTPVQQQTNGHSAPSVWRFEQGQQVNEFRDLRANPRILLESQLFALRIRSAPVNKRTIERVLCVGEAASCLPALADLVASVFCAEVYTPHPSSSSPEAERYRAATGSAYAAKFVWLNQTSEPTCSYEESTRKQLNAAALGRKNSATATLASASATSLSVLVEEPEEQSDLHSGAYGAYTTTLDEMATLGLEQAAVPDRDVCEAYGSLIPEYVRLGEVVRKAEMGA